MTHCFKDISRMVDAVNEIILNRDDLKPIKANITNALRKQAMKWHLSQVPYKGIILPKYMPTNSTYQFQLVVENTIMTSYTHETFVLDQNTFDCSPSYDRIDDHF